MDPTVLCFLALVAAGPADGIETVYTGKPVAAHVEIDDAPRSTWKTTPAATNTASGRFRTEPVAVEKQIATPFGSVETVLRGQSPVMITQQGPVITQPIEVPMNSPIMAPPAAAGVYPMLPPMLTWRHYAVYENVIVAPYFSQNTSAVTTSPGIATSVRQFDWDLEYSSRIEVGVVDSQGAGWRARYWHFDHSERSGGTAVGGRVVNISPDAISNSGISAANGGAAQATHSLRMSVIDLEFLKQGLTAEPGFDISFGLRYARMDQWLRGRAADPAVPDDGVPGNNSVHHDFEGIGPTIAAEYSRPLWFSYWSVFGNARASLLYGDSNYRYDRRDAAGTLVVNATNNGDQDLLSVFEMQIGVEHRCPIFCCHELFVRAALEGQYWANAGSASADMTGSGSDNAQDADLGFFGFVISTGLDW